jgi:alpha-methylacyl-CoA racemase
MGPLEGVRVVELAGLGPAPMCGMMLSDMGAEVFLVERPGAASAESTLHAGRRDMLKRGKLALPLDLKDEADAQTLLDLLDCSDVFIESYRPGVMERLGLGPERCLAANPRLVYARLSGWGQTGPLAPYAGHDANYAALSGALYHSGCADSVPLAPPTMLGDAAGGAAILAWGISSALVAVARHGRGQVMDASIFEGTCYLTSLVRSFYINGQLTDERQGGWMDGAAPWGRSYRCADGGFMTVLAVESKFYRIFLEKLGLADEQLFGAANQWNSSAWPAQIERFCAVFAAHDRAHWEAVFKDSDACVSPVLTYGEAPQHEHARERGVFHQVDGDWYANPAPRFSGTPAEPAWEEAEVDVHARLRELGIGAPT